MLFDPWEQAASLARLLENARASTRLVVALGAQWCHQCEERRPLFDALAQTPQGPTTDLFIWLDLDEHAHFLGDYVPEDLPELLIYKQGQLCNRGVLNNLSEGLALLNNVGAPIVLPETDHPDVWQRLLEPDWATDAPRP